MEFENLKADLVSEPIQGYLPDGRFIDIPLISHVTDNLYVGGHADGVDLGDFFSHIFSLYVWGAPYASHTDTVHGSVEMFDSPTEDTDKVEHIVNEVVEALEKGGNVLVHCQAGINRSNITAALALMKWKNLSADEAIALLREKRSPLVLANSSFERYLRALDS